MSEESVLSLSTWKRSLMVSVLRQKAAQLLRNVFIRLWDEALAHRLTTLLVAAFDD